MTKDHDVSDAMRIAAKRPKDEVHYRLGDKKDGYCRNCRFFERLGPKRCLKVQGRIEPEMTCDLFEAK
jgi:hypothetical protein